MEKHAYMFEQIVVSLLTSASLIVAAGFILKTFFRATVEGWLNHSFNTKLEEAKSAFRKEEEKLRAELKSNEALLESIKAAALSNMAARNQVLDKRRVEALERLWNAVVEMQPLRTIAKLSETVHMDKLIETAAEKNSDGQKTRDFANVLWTSTGLEKFNVSAAPDKERPFVSPLVWSLFSAYRQFLFLPMAQLAAAKTGVGIKMLADSKPLLNLAKTTLPNLSGFIDKVGIESIPHLLEDVERKLLSEIVKGLEGVDSDNNALERAIEIQKAASKAEAALKAAIPGDPGAAFKTPTFP